jgi:hypothetical protein
MGQQIRLDNIVIAFVDRLFEAKGSTEDPENKKYGFNVQLDPKKNAAAIKEIDAAIDQVAKDKWGEEAKGYGRCLRSNEEAEKSYYPPDAFFISANTQDRIATVDRQGKLVNEEDARNADIFHSGSICIGVFELYTTDKGGRKVCAAPSGLQYVAEGERHLGRSLESRSNDFAPIEDDDDIL